MGFFKYVGLQIYACISVTLTTLSAGMVIAYVTTAVPSLMPADNSTTATHANFNLTENQAAWLNSETAIGITAGTFLVCPIITAIGRKATFLYVIGPGYLLGFILTAGSQNVIMLLMSRLISSFFTGVTFSAAPIYIMEIADVNIRGILGTFPQIMITVGILISYIIGAYVDWMWLAILSALLVIPQMLSTIFIPESPLWLVSKGRSDEAFQVLLKLREPTEAETELQNIIQSLQKPDDGKSESILTILSEPPVLKSFLAAVGLMVIQQFSGISAVIMNAVMIFQEAGTNMNSNVCSIIIAVMQVVASGVAMGLVERTGRKILLYLSSVMMTISLSALGAYFYLKEYGNVESLLWLPLVSLISYIVFYCLGYGALPILISAEIIPKQALAKLNPIVFAITGVCFFIVTFTFEYMETSIGMYGIFWFYSGVSAISLIFDVFCIPETKGKTCEEIQEFYGASKNIHQILNDSDSSIEIDNGKSINIPGHLSLYKKL